MAWQRIKSRNGMETIDGVGTNRWKVRMVTEEKWRRKPEEREI